MWCVILYATFTIVACLAVHLLETLAMRERIKRANRLRREYRLARHDFSTLRLETTVKKES